MHGICFFHCTQPSYCVGFPLFCEFIFEAIFFLDKLLLFCPSMQVCKVESFPGDRHQRCKYAPSTHLSHDNLTPELLAPSFRPKCHDMSRLRTAFIALDGHTGHPKKNSFPIICRLWMDPAAAGMRGRPSGDSLPVAYERRRRSEL